MFPTAQKATVLPATVAPSLAAQLALTVLLVLVLVQVQDPPACPGLHHISSLTQLQHLAVWTDWNEILARYDRFNAKWPVLPEHVLPALSGLTRLEANLFDVPALADLSSCTNLQHLAVCMTRDHVDLSPADWAGLAALTQLTELRLLNVCITEASPEACEALGKLTRLQVAAAFEWHLAFVPALTACVRLTEVCGEWHWPQDSSRHVVHTLPQVQVLTASCGLEPGTHVRYECFPNLRCLRQDVLYDGNPFQHVFVICPSDLHLICKHCTGLQELSLTAETASLLPEEEHEGPVNTVAAVQSLTSLQCLTRLVFTPYHDLEHLALVQACRVLESHSLQELHVIEGGMGAEVTLPAWLQLGQLRQLRKLSVRVTQKSTYAGLMKQALVFMSALAGCGAVMLQLPGSNGPFVAALAALRDAGLPAPPVVLWGE